MSQIAVKSSAACARFRRAEVWLEGRDPGLPPLK